MRLLFTAAVAVFLAACGTAPEGATPPVDAAPIEVELQGHRGCRGLLPENTWPAFQHAMDLGVTTINAPEDMEKLVALGVDGIITDYPNRFVAFAEE